MNTLEIKTSVKVVGANGQISLGKEFAGRQVLVEEREPGVWLIRTARVIPENELWLHEPKASRDLQRALIWAQNNRPSESDPDAIFEKLSNESKPKRKSGQTRS
ncbi:MAG: hypothetical protein AAB115_00820 [Pseudomonadota bacterium]